MTTMTIHDVDEMLLNLVREEAERSGCPVDAWVRGTLYAQLCRTLPADSGVSLLAAIRARVEPLGGVELALPPRPSMREPPDFGG